MYVVLTRHPYYTAHLIVGLIIFYSCTSLVITGVSRQLECGDGVHTCSTAECSMTGCVLPNQTVLLIINSSSSVTMIDIQNSTFDQLTVAVVNASQGSSYQLIITNVRATSLITVVGALSLVVVVLSVAPQMSLQQMADGVTVSVSDCEFVMGSPLQGSGSVIELIDSHVSNFSIFNTSFSSACSADASALITLTNCSTSEAGITVANVTAVATASSAVGMCLLSLSASRLSPQTRILLVGTSINISEEISLSCGGNGMPTVNTSLPGSALIRVTNSTTSTDSYFSLALQNVSLALDGSSATVLQWSDALSVLQWSDALLWTLGSGSFHVSIAGCRINLRSYSPAAATSTVVALVSSANTTSGIARPSSSFGAAAESVWFVALTVTDSEMQIDHNGTGYLVDISDSSSRDNVSISVVLNRSSVGITSSSAPTNATVAAVLQATLGASSAVITLSVNSSFVHLDAAPNVSLVATAVAASSSTTISIQMANAVIILESSRSVEHGVASIFSQWGTNSARAMTFVSVVVDTTIAVNGSTASSICCLLLDLSSFYDVTVDWAGVACTSTGTTGVAVLLPVGTELPPAAATAVIHVVILNTTITPVGLSNQSGFVALLVNCSADGTTTASTVTLMLHQSIFSGSIIAQTTNSSAFTVNASNSTVNGGSVVLSGLVGANSSSVREVVIVALSLPAFAVIGMAGAFFSVLISDCDISVINGTTSTNASVALVDVPSAASVPLVLSNLRLQANVTLLQPSLTLMGLFLRSASSLSLIDVTVVLTVDIPDNTSSCGASVAACSLDGSAPSSLANADVTATVCTVIVLSVGNCATPSNAAALTLSGTMPSATLQASAFVALGSGAVNSVEILSGVSSTCAQEPALAIDNCNITVRNADRAFGINALFSPYTTMSLATSVVNTTVTISGVRSEAYGLLIAASVVSDTTVTVEMVGTYAASLLCGVVLPPLLCTVVTDVTVSITGTLAATGALVALGVDGGNATLSTAENVSISAVTITIDVSTVSSSCCSLSSLPLSSIQGLLVRCAAALTTVDISAVTVDVTSTVTTPGTVAIAGINIVGPLRANITVQSSMVYLYVTFQQGVLSSTNDSSASSVTALNVSLGTPSSNESCPYSSIETPTAVNINANSFSIDIFCNTGPVLLLTALVLQYGCADSVVLGGSYWVSQYEAAVSFGYPSSNHVGEALALVIFTTAVGTSQGSITITNVDSYVYLENVLNVTVLRNSWFSLPSDDSAVSVLMSWCSATLSAGTVNRLYMFDIAGNGGTLTSTNLWTSININVATLVTFLSVTGMASVSVTSSNLVLSSPASVVGLAPLEIDGRYGAPCTAVFNDNTLTLGLALVSSANIALVAVSSCGHLSVGDNTVIMSLSGPQANGSVALFYVEQPASPPTPLVALISGNTWTVEEPPNSTVGLLVAPIALNTSSCGGGTPCDGSLIRVQDTGNLYVIASPDSFTGMVPPVYTVLADTATGVGTGVTAGFNEADDAAFARLDFHLTVEPPCSLVHWGDDAASRFPHPHNTTYINISHRCWTSTMSPTPSASQTLTRSISVTATDDTVSPSIKASASHSLESSETPTFSHTGSNPVISLKSLLSPQLATAVTITTTTTAAVSAAGSNAGGAMQMARLTGVLAIVTQCYSGQSIASKIMLQDSIPFPQSIVPVLQLGPDTGAFQRGTALSNSMILAATVSVLGTVAGVFVRYTLAVKSSSEELYVDELQGPLSKLRGALRTLMVPGSLIVVISLGLSGLVTSAVTLLMQPDPPPYNFAIAGLALCWLGAFVYITITRVSRLRRILKYLPVTILHQDEDYRSVMPAQRWQQVAIRLLLLGESCWLPDDPSSSSTSRQNAEGVSLLTLWRAAVAYDEWGMLLNSFRGTPYTGGTERPSLITSVVPYWLTIEVVVTATTAAAHGIAVRSCTAALIVAVSGNLALFFLSVVARPYSVPVKNFFTIMNNLLVAATAIAALAGQSEIAALLSAASGIGTFPGTVLSVIFYLVVRLFLRGIIGFDRELWRRKNTPHELAAASEELQVIAAAQAQEPAEEIRNPVSAEEAPDRRSDDDFIDSLLLREEEKAAAEAKRKEAAAAENAQRLLTEISRAFNVSSRPRMTAASAPVSIRDEELDALLIHHDHVLVESNDMDLL